jgi:septal ring factor EnvC (AmiA/AmiB activator)
VSRRCIFLAAFLTWAVLFNAAAVRADNREDLQALRAKIERVQRELAAAESTRSEAADALKVSEKAISEVRRALHQLAREQQVLKVSLAGIEQRVLAQGADAARQQQLFDRLIRHQYMRGGNDSLRLILEGRDVAAVEREIHYYGYIAKLRAETIRRIRKSLADLALLQAQARGKQDELATNEQQQQRVKDTLEAERRERRKVLDRIAGNIEKSRREIGRLKRDEERLSKLVQQLGKALAATARSRKPGQAVDEAADTSFIGKAFQTLKGKLKLPLKGELSNRFGSPREEGGISWKGLFIRARSGEAVRAVADGRVVYADWLRGFGNLLIIDHGAGYMSLYGNNESVLKQVGELAQSGEAVAAVGESGGAGESGLYFELRYQGKPLDPMKWTGK